MPFENLIDLYVSSDVAMITPLRDGMNLVAKEYLATRINNDGVLILSELAGASKLPQAISVNPFDIEQLSQAIKTAVEMPLKSKGRNLILNRIKRYDINKWSSNFIDTLNETSKKEFSSKVKLVTPVITKKIVKSYQESKKRLLLLDYDGTLVGFNENPEKVVPPKSLLDLLDNINSHENTDVVIMSGRTYSFLDKHFAGLNLTLVAEHGLYLKEKNSEWHQKKGLSKKWIEHLLPVLNTFTPGTFIEHKTNSLHGITEKQILN